MTSHSWKGQIAKLLGVGKAERGLTVRPDDVFVVSYPKSGNTWTRFLIANLFYQQEEITFLNIEQKVPDIYQNTDRDLLKLAGSRVLKSHEYYDPRYRKVIYIVRDPRDVLISFYYHSLKFLSLQEGTSIDQFAEKFFTGEQLEDFGSWGGNVGSWIGAREGDADFLLLRYEDMLADTKRELRKIAAFLEMTCTEEQLEETIRKSSADHMRKLEQAQADQWKLTRNTRKDIQFVRSAKAGGWREELPPQVAEKIEAAWGRHLDTCGYR